MKASWTLTALAAATMGAAQDAGSLPACAQTCIGNMLALAPSLGCSATDAACLCKSVDFGYGIRDCSLAVCANDADAAKRAIEYGSQYCAAALGSAGASSVAAETGSATGTSSGSVIATPTRPASNVTAITSTLVATITSEGSIITTATGTTTISGGGAGQSGIPITTEALTAVITTDGQEIVTTTGFTTIYSATEGVISSATASASAAISSASGAVSSASKAISSAAASATGSSTSSGLAAMVTAAPALIGAGVLAVLAL